MARHTCNNCGATVPDGEQFCPNCGNWIDHLAEPVDQPQASEDFESFSLEEEPPVADPTVTRYPRNELPCPSCGASNPSNNRHCEQCGARLTQGALPVAPRPAVQQTAGVRAAMAIAGVLLGVVLITVLFSIFTGGDDEEPTASDTTTSSTAPSTTITPSEVTILSVECTIEPISGFPCSNLIDGETSEYQIAWEELEPEQVVEINLIFPEAMVITDLIWENIGPDEGDRFLQNYRVQSISVTDDNGRAVGIPLEDEAGVQRLVYESLRTNELTITIDQIYEAQAVGDNVFSDLAIQNISVQGFPFSAISNGTDTTDATTGDTTDDTDDTTDEG